VFLSFRRREGLAELWTTRRTYAGRVSQLTTAQFLIAFAIAAAAGTAVFFHAEKRKIKHPSAWASFVFLFLIVGLPAYAFHVRRIQRTR
jgi:uncharacterized membrane protein YcaP (DUF421 family)